MPTVTETTQPLPDAVALPAARGPGVLSRLLRNISGVVGLVLVLLFLCAGALGGLGITPYPPNEQHVPDRMQGPSAAYVMGTDLFGRDVASRLMKGAANSLQVALSAVALSGLIGTTIGAVAGYLGGLVDNILMRIMDVFFAFPTILLALLVVAVLGPGLRNTILAITVVYSPIFARVARGPVLSVKEMEFVTAAHCIGLREWRVLLRHVLPNTVAPLIVQVSLALSWALITEAGLSFLGLGTQPPEPSWGLMLSEGRSLAEIAPWLVAFPGLAIMVGVLGFNLLGDGLRDVLDPRLRGLR
ncbi:MAG: ABC transporter permease [Anaerolineae bacterium]|nr:ABC transporter permease [Anaerolineae bacterium]